MMDDRGAHGATRDEADRFLLLAIHDLRAPLRESLIRAELLHRCVSGTLPEAGEAHLLAVVEANRAMDRFLKRLAQFSQAGSGIDRSPKVSVEFLVRQAIQTVGLETVVPPVELLTGELPDISLPAPVQTVFAELLDNALKFRAGPASIELRFAQSDSERVFQVRDNGIGFEPEFAARILEPLTRLHGMSVYPGFGFGLAISRRIVEALDGRLWGESSPGQGSTFYFALPAA